MGVVLKIDDEIYEPEREEDFTNQQHIKFEDKRMHKLTCAKLTFSQ